MDQNISASDHGSSSEELEDTLGDHDPDPFEDRSVMLPPSASKKASRSKEIEKVEHLDDDYVEPIDEESISDSNYDSDKELWEQDQKNHNIATKSVNNRFTAPTLGLTRPTIQAGQLAQSNKSSTSGTRSKKRTYMMPRHAEKTPIPAKILQDQSEDPKATHPNHDSIDHEDADTLRRRLRETMARLVEAEAGAILGLHSSVNIYEYIVFHFIDPHDENDQTPRIYLEQPRWALGEDGGIILEAHSPIRGVEHYLYQHPEIAFVFYKDYNSTPPKEIVKIENKDGKFQKAEPYETTLVLTADSMRESFREFIRLIPDWNLWYPDFSVEAQIWAPDRFAYHCRKHMKSICEALTPKHAKLVQLLMDAINDIYGQKYLHADAQAEQGMVTKESLVYLIKPGDILVKLDGLQTRAYKATSWVGYCQTTETIQKDEQNTDGQTDSAREPRKQTRNQGNLTKRITYQFPINSSSYEFDGVFELVQVQWGPIELKLVHEDEKVRIDSLNYFPPQFASEQVREMLLRRGKMFWNCRRRLLVTHHHEADSHTTNTNDRYMVDMLSCRKLFPSLFTTTPRRDDLSDFMDMDEPPSDTHALIFPPTIMGYNLQTKKCRTLFVEKIQHIVWNSQAFDHLVIEPETKDLVLALVSSQLKAEQTTDLISGKGGGLILLLHGAPGTGKTFTAEGVAEVARKPLLRVTCGDVGIEPRQVEKYLSRWFRLGKIWDCVVLLDEADVFLEERDIKDLNRNALVSVFLRVIEYYQGILILTSNRVGTFDEAFKSRIQLALHYENLMLWQRRGIWRNFMERLKKMDNGSNIDFNDVIDHLDELMRPKMNGREIRNVITTARQLAMYKGQRLTYTHLKHAIDVGGKFGKYLTDLREGTDDDLKREGGIR